MRRDLWPVVAVLDRFCSCCLDRCELTLLFVALMGGAPVVLCPICDNPANAS